VLSGDTPTRSGELDGPGICSTRSSPNALAKTPLKADRSFLSPSIPRRGVPACQAASRARSAGLEDRHRRGSPVLGRFDSFAAPALVSAARGLEAALSSADDTEQTATARIVLATGPGTGVVWRHACSSAEAGASSARRRGDWVASDARTTTAHLLLCLRARTAVVRARRVVRSQALGRGSTGCSSCHQPAAASAGTACGSRRNASRRRPPST
jgi:hypothetical protein